MVALEIEGVHRSRTTRHLTITGYRNDCIKYNAAQVLGWVVLRYTQDMWMGQAWVPDVEACLEASMARGRQVPRIMTR